MKKIIMDEFEITLNENGDQIYRKNIITGYEFWTVYNKDGKLVYTIDSEGNERWFDGNKRVYAKNNI